YLETQNGARVRELAHSGKGFGIVAGTGTGKTLAIRPIAEEILATVELKVGVVNREREATPETPTWNVIIVTTGIARRWFEEGDILKTDTLVVDEIHQTSAELELCLALGKRTGCRFVWLSATVDPTFYRAYLTSADVLEVYEFDKDKAAQVKVVNKDPLEFLDQRFFNVIDRGRNVLTQEHLGANEILQMAGRVHGRVEGGRVFILSDREIYFAALKPTAPEFQLAGDSERVAITCAALGVRADELELPVPLDKTAYRNAL